MGEDREIVLDYNAACPYYRRNLPVMVTSRAIWVMSAYMDREFKSFHNDDGTFTVEEAYPGTVMLMIRSQGYAEKTVEVDGVLSAATREGVVITLETGLSLTGTVMNSSGEALAGAYLYVGPLPQSEWEYEREAKATTNASGAYTLNALPSGAVNISAYATGYLGESLTTQLGGTNNTLDFYLNTGGTVEGTVYVNGKGQTGVQLYGSATGSGGRQNVQGQTDANGWYSLRGLPAGSVSLNASYNDGTQQRNLNATVEVALDMITDQDFQFVTGNSSVEGYLLTGPDQPVSGNAWIQVDTGNGIESRYTEVGGNGHFLFEHLPAGTLNLRGAASNPPGQKRITQELAANTALRLDIHLYGGVTVAVNVENSPGEGNIVLALPANYPVPATMSEHIYSELNQVTLMYAMGIENGLGFRYVEPGDYTVVAISYARPDNHRIDWATAAITSAPLHVQGDANTSVTLSF